MGQDGIPMSIALLCVGTIFGAMLLIGMVILGMFLA